jgi:hypothetical protein
VVVLRVQPHEGIAVKFGAKPPELELRARGAM